MPNMTLRERKPGDENLKAAGCQSDSNGRQDLGNGAIRFTFPDMDRWCGDCSLFGANITITPGNPATFRLLGTLNSSDNGDRWEMRLSFRRGDGSELFTLPQAGFWMGFDILQKDTPQALDFSGDPQLPKFTYIPPNFADAVSVHLYAEC